MSVTTVNVWTGSPLMALWVGSRVQTLGASTMAAFATVAVVMAVISLTLVQVLSHLGAAYDRLVERRPQVRRPRRGCARCAASVPMSRAPSTACPRSR